jgi:hypothetical protein
MINCTFSELKKILLDLGYEMKVAPGKAFVFEHEPAHSRLYLEPFADSDKVDTTTLAIVAHNLDVRGILPRDQFYDLLRQRSLAG